MIDPLFHKIWMNPHDPLSQSFKNFCVVILIDCLSCRNPLSVNITHGTKEAHNHTFLFWLGQACFLAFTLATLVESIWTIHKNQTEFGRRIGLNPCTYPHLLCYKFSGIIHCRLLFGHCRHHEMKTLHGYYTAQIVSCGQYWWHLVRQIVKWRFRLHLLMCQSLQNFRYRWQKCCQQITGFLFILAPQNLVMFVVLLIITFLELVTM